MDRYNEKDRRKQRRRNFYAKDLMTPKYRQQYVPNKKKKNTENIEDEWE